MGFFASRNDDDYEKALLAAEVNPKGLTTDQKNMLKTLCKEPGQRGNRARKAVGEDD